MPIPVTPKPQFPNVPNAPGVPPLQRAANVQGSIVLLGADTVSALSGLGALLAPQWGLFNSDGSPAFGGAASGILSVVTSLIGLGGGQSVGDVEYRLDHRIATAPQEQGAFLSYNKVSTPFNGRVTYIVSGFEAQRGAFLAAVLAAQKTTNLYTLIMPEISYPSCDIVHHDMRRTAVRGLTMIAVDIWVEEVRVTGTAAYSNTAQPSGTDQSNGGTVQPQTPGTGQTPSAPSNDTGIGTGGQDGVGGTGQGTTVGVPSEPYFDDNGKQIGIAPSATPATGPIVGSYANGQPVIGGSWQQGFYDSNLNWVHP